MDWRIYAVFVLVVIVAITNALLSTNKIRKNKNTIFYITQYTNPSLEGLEEFNLLITRSRMYISNWVYLPDNNNDKNGLIQLNYVSYPRLKSRIIKLTSGWHVNEHVSQVHRLFGEYESIMREQEKIVKSLVASTDYAEPLKIALAKEQLENEIIPKTNKLIVRLRELNSIKREEARQMQSAMLDDNKALLVFGFTMAIIIIFSVMMAGVYMMQKVILPMIRMREVLLRMSAGELPNVVTGNETGALREMKIALGQLRDGLQRTSSFANEIGHGNFDAAFEPLSDKDVLGSALLEMRQKLKQAADDDATRNWASEGFAYMSTVFHQHTDNIARLSDEIIEGLVAYIDGNYGAIYLVNDDNENDIFIQRISTVSSSSNTHKSRRVEWEEGPVGQAIAHNKKTLYRGDHNVTETGNGDVLIIPLFAGGRVIGAIEIGSTRTLPMTAVNFVERIAEPVAINILNLKTNLLTRRLLVESQMKTRELAHQDEELRQINNELLSQSGKLLDSETNLKKQQKVLQRVNKELENKALLLEEKNMAVEDAHKALAFKAEQLERSNKYKSDFLANMSHELRTPLNSVLILARLLAENREGNMTTRQIDHARVIHKSGSDLLVIINDILDLSKIEAGKLELHKENTEIAEICNNMEQLFTEMSREKEIAFSIHMDDGIPGHVYTDRVRTEQILKNLLSNAFKFTPGGGTVTLRVQVVSDTTTLQVDKLLHASKVVCFSVTDSGIGIPAEKQKHVFGAFNQADSSITRRYGGTGLGLAICRQLTVLLGGEIKMESVEGEGSTFMLLLPVDKMEPDQAKSPEPGNHTGDHDELKPGQPGGHYLVICQDDGITGQWETLISNSGNTCALMHKLNLLKVESSPDVIIIDATLSDKEYTKLVNRIKGYGKTRSAIVVCRSVSEYVPREIRSLVSLHTTMQPDAVLMKRIDELFIGSRIVAHSSVSVSATNSTTAGKRMCIDTPLCDKDRKLNGVKILIADDDIRNIYSMTTYFENEGAEVLCAMDGNEAMEVFHANPSLSLILMDIMMPGKDGLEAIRDIRALKHPNATIPIIAVTAKAMRNDRELCISTGATDYVTKPVNMEYLLQKVYQLIAVEG